MAKPHKQLISVQAIAPEAQKQMPTKNASPFAWLPYYLPQEEMEAIWRVWGRRVLGQEPVAEEDREAFELVCRQLHTNWGAVYRPVTLLPPLHPPLETLEDRRLLNQCLAAGWTLYQQHAAVTAEALSSATGTPLPVVESLLPRIHDLLKQAKALTMKGAYHV